MYNIIKTFIGSLLAVSFSFCLYKLKKKCPWFRCVHFNVRSRSTNNLPIVALPSTSSSSRGIVMDIGHGSVSYDPSASSSSSSPPPPPYAQTPLKKNVRFSTEAILNSPLNLIDLPTSTLRRSMSSPLPAPPPPPIQNLYDEFSTSDEENDDMYGKFFYLFFPTFYFFWGFCV